MKTIISAFLLLFLTIVSPLSAQDDEQATLDELVAEFAASIDGAAVAVQITVEGEAWSAAGGFADGQRATTPSDRFRIGSVSKTFLAVTALLLAEDGVIDLDSPAADYLSESLVENIANVESVTLRQLLAMRSGVPDYLETDEFWGAVGENPSRIWTAAEALTYAYDLPAMFAPDEDYYYSNSNYLLAQLVLESATGTSLEALIRERILIPVGMDETYTQIFESLPGGFVHGYEDFDGNGEVENVSDINDGAGMGDGGLISTVGDLTKFYEALLVDEALLSEDSLEELLTFQEDDEDGQYSLGFSAWDTEFGTVWGHSGGVLGFQSLALYIPDEDVMVMVLVASNDLSPEDVARAVVTDFFGD